MQMKSKKVKVKISLISASLCLCGSLFVYASAASAQWIKQAVNTTASFRGLSVVNEKVIWAGGTGGTVIRTIDGGKTWKVMTVPGAEKLDFRDIEAFDANIAYILSIGNGESSRIYKTYDGGVTWRLEFQNKDSSAFYDAIACWDSEHCIAMSDPVAGSFLVMVRRPSDPGVNGFARKGVSWNHAIYKAPAFEGEAAFAASGTCLLVTGNYVRRTTDARGAISGSSGLMVSGGKGARVFKTTDGGVSWTPSEAEFVHGTPSSGIFSIAMFDSDNGVIVGGNYEKPDEARDNLAFTNDGGQTWELGTGLSGYRSAVAYVDKKTLIAVGTNGTDLSSDGGKTWKKIGSEDLNAVAAKGKNAAWAVGSKGMVAKLK